MGKVVYTLGFPKLSNNGKLLIFDKKLAKNSDTKKWLESFPSRIPVHAGESLKDLNNFSVLAQKVLKKIQGQPVNEITLVAVGGGSVGDAVGFLASVLKRGVRLIHIPTTWLAALDSAHGGKTALNIGQYKNQIGSFYSAEKILISRRLLSTQSHRQIDSAYGELFKIALIRGGALSRKVLNLKRLDESSMWKTLPLAVDAKLKIVKADPLEKKKIRYLLNLGHSFGHALELEHGWPHGKAVLYGTHFALKWSLRRKILSQKQFDKICNAILIRPGRVKRLTSQTLRRNLLQDKKTAGRSGLNFVFVEKVGQCKLEKVSVNEILGEAKLQGWI